MKKATFVKQATGMSGHAEVYEVDPPIKGYSWGEESTPEYGTVVVSSVSGIATECYIFAWDIENDEVESWSELKGSRKGAVMPKELLQELGYEIVYQD